MEADKRAHYRHPLVPALAELIEPQALSEVTLPSNCANLSFVGS